MSLIEQKKNFLEKLKKNLMLLKTDLDLSNSGYKSFYIVDFSAIFAYIYRTFESSFISQLPPDDGQQSEKTFARLQTALEVVFNPKRNNLLLIPPYALEIENHLKSVRLNVKIKSLGIRDRYKVKLKKMLNDSIDLNTYMNQIKTSEDSDGGRAALLDLGKRYFSELYTVVMMSVVEPFLTLKRLLTENILLNSETFFTEIKDINYTTNDKIESWYKSMIAERRGKRAYQTYIDAMACTYVEEANRKLNPEKIILYFITPSKHVIKTIRDKLFVPINYNKHSTVIRDLDYFLLYITYDSNLERIEDTIKVLDGLILIYDDDNNMDNEIKSRGSELLQESRQTLNQIENLMMVSDIESSKKFQSYIDLKKSGEKIFINLLIKMFEAINTKQIEIDVEVERLFEHLNEQVDCVNLDKWLSSKDLMNTLHSTIVKNISSKFVLLPGVPGEMPIWIVFSDPNIVSLAQKISKFIRYKSVNKLQSLRQEIMNESTKPHISTEIYLLVGYILAMEKKWDSATKELEKGLKESRIEIKNEFLYFLGTIYRILFDYNKAKDFLKKALNNKKDQRFLLEYGNSLWVHWVVEYYSEVERKPHLVKAKGKLLLKKAICYVERSKKIGDKKKEKNKIFNAQIHNLLAFLYTEMASYEMEDKEDYIEKAQKKN